MTNNSITNTSQKNELILKMKLIHTKFDSIQIFFGITLLKLTLSTLQSTIYQISWLINSSLNAYDIGSVPSVISGLLSILIILYLGKISDSIGRWPILFGCSLLCIIGSLIQAFAPSFLLYSIGSIINGLGNNCLNLILSIILADYLKPSNRGFAFIITWFPDITTYFTTIPIIGLIQSWGNNWRLLFNCQAIAVGVTSLPILFCLFKLQVRAKRLLIDYNYKIINLTKLLDWKSLLLLTIGIGLNLIPLNLVIRSINGFQNASILTPIILGILTLLILIVREQKYSSNPLFNTNILINNRSILLIIIIRAINVIALTFSLDYLVNHFTLTHDMSQTKSSQIFLGCRIARFVGGAISAILTSYYKKPKLIIILGFLITLIGYSISIYSRLPSTPDWLIIISEISIRLGSGITFCVSPIILQSGVNYWEIATITSIDKILQICCTISASAITSVIWNYLTINNLTAELPSIYHSEIQGLIKDLNSFTKVLPVEVKSNWIRALSETQYIFCIISTSLGVICFLISFGLNNINLENCQKLEVEESNNEVDKV